MAIRIRSFSHQNMVILSPYRYNIKITGNPSNVRVEGLPDNFFYNWTPNRNRLEIRGTPEKYVYDKQMVVTADNVVYTQTYSVVPILPNYNQNIRSVVIRGVPFTLRVAVDNWLDKLDVRGPWVGLETKNDRFNFDLFGNIPEDCNFTKDSFIFNVSVSNYSGTVNGTITLTPRDLSDLKFYILDGNILRVYNVTIPITGIEQTITQIKSFNLPNIPGSTANYVAVANNGTNLYLLHSKPQSAITSNPIQSSDLDDQIIVVSPATANNNTAGIIRRFNITRHSSFYNHELSDIYYHNGNLYILTSYPDDISYSSYFVLYNENLGVRRIINLLETGGGISITQGFVTAVLYTRSINASNFFRIYPPGYIDGIPLSSESAQTYTENDVILSNLNININDVTMTSINNYAYILSSTLPNKLSIVEVPTPVGTPVRRGTITLSPSLTRPQGITSL